MNLKNLIFTLDSYKDLHDKMLPEGTEIVYDYLESRTGAQYDYTLFFGLQYILKEWLIGSVITKELIDEAEPLLKDHFKYSGDVWDRAKWDYIVEKHGGKLPVRIKAVAEGVRLPTSNVLMTVENTDPNCGWLSGALETLLQHVWYTSTVATRSHYIVSIIKKYFKETVEDSNQWLADYYLHDFGQRAVSGTEQAGLGGLAHLINSKGTDSKMSILYAINYYGSNGKDLCHSVPASEHSVATAEGEENEFEVTKRLIKTFPNGVLSIVSDSYDIERAVNTYCNELKPYILQRNGKFVIRPDSPRFNGDTPAKQVLWIVQTLWTGFGGGINTKGYKVLDSHVGVIYGDSLTENEIEEVLKTLKDNGFSAESCVYGCGGYLLQRLNRDTQRMAFKSSAQKRNGIWYDVFKNPKDKSKASKKGRLQLIRKSEPNGFVYETVPFNPINQDILQTVYEDGKLLIEYSLDDVKRNSINS